MVSRRNLMVLTVDDRRKMAALFSLFAQIDARNKRNKKAKKKSQSQEEKARGPTRIMRALIFY